VTEIIHDAKTQWLMERAELVTATDGADLVCHAMGDDSAYRAPAEILAVKWGLVPDEDENCAMMWGRELQDSIARVYGRVKGRTVTLVPEYTLWRHASIPWLASSGDALTTINGKAAPLEVKSDGSRWESDESPLRHRAQLQIQEACIGAEAGALAAFVDRFRPIREEDVAFNKAFFTSILPLMEEFYHYLKTRTMPKDPSWYTKAATKAFWGHSNGATVALDHDDLETVRRWEIAKDTIKLAEAHKDECEVALAVRIGDNYAGALPDGSQYRIGRSPIEPQRCGCGHIIKAAHVRITPRRWWPKHLAQANKALSSKKVGK